MVRLMRLRSIVLSVLLVSLALTGSAQAATPGINVAGVPTAGNAAQVIATGAKYARYFVLWSDMQPTPGALNAPLLATYQSSLAQLQAAGVKVDLVVTAAPSWANGSPDRMVPPNNPRDMATFMGQLATALKGKVAAYEIWNEPDSNEFWHATLDAARYTALLKAVYPATKAADPGAVVLSGPFSGNDYDFMAQMYAAGAKGSYDGVSVHTDTACLNSGPTQYYRDGSRIGRFSFLGYRELHTTMIANNDPAPIWITELGWSSTVTQCERGTWAGGKTAGVGEAGQATALQQAYHCMAQEPAIAVAEWFTLNDAGTADTEMNRYGLLRPNGTQKPAYTAFRNEALNGDKLTGGCGDFSGPTIKVNQPTAGAQFVSNLVLSASAHSADGLSRISFLCDGKKVATFSPVASDKVITMTWYGSSNLPAGQHQIEVQSTDKAGNLSTSDVVVTKVDLAKLAPQRTWVVAKVTGSGLIRTVTGQVKSTLPFSIKGRVRFYFQIREGATWISRHKASRNSRTPFRVVQRLARAGQWRVKIVYTGSGPFKPSTAPLTAFTARR